jgi:PAS domain S-box-containing protein
MKTTSSTPATTLQKKELWDFILDQNKLPVLMLDREKRVTYVNRALCRLTGFNKSELLGKTPPFPWWPSEATANYNQKLNYALSKGTHRMVLRFQRKDGRLFWVKIISFPVYRKKEFLYYFSTWIDISKQIEIEEKIKTEKILLDRLFESAEEGIVLVDLQGQVIRVNRKFCQIFGYSPQEIISMLWKSPKKWPLEKKSLLKPSAGEKTDSRYMFRSWLLRLKSMVNSGLITESIGILPRKNRPNRK